jgi:hypothetical protein
MAQDSATRASRRVRVALQQLSASETASTTSFTPSRETVGAFKSKLVAFTRRALDLPFGAARGLRLDVDPAQMDRFLHPFFYDVRAQLLRLLAEDPVFKNKHYLGMSVAAQRELVLEQVKRFAGSGIYRFLDLVENPLRWVTCMETLSYQ